MEHSKGSGKNTKFKKGEQANSASVETIPNGDKIRWAKRSVKNIVHMCLRIMPDAAFKDLHFRNLIDSLLATGWSVNWNITGYISGGKSYNWSDAFSCDHFISNKCVIIPLSITWGVLKVTRLWTLAITFEVGLIHFKSPPLGIVVNVSVKLCLRGGY